MGVSMKIYSQNRRYLKGYGRNATPDDISDFVVNTVTITYMSYVTALTVCFRLFSLHEYLSLKCVYIEDVII